MNESMKTGVWDITKDEALGYCEFKPQSTPELTIRALELELESVKKDNANLIEMNFNLEQQVSALKEDLEESNDECLNWSDENAELTRQLEELLAAMSQIKDIAENV
jgi:FtsZ-binding cell division protein ZapB